MWCWRQGYSWNGTYLGSHSYSIKETAQAWPAVDITMGWQPFLKSLTTFHHLRFEEDRCFHQSVSIFYSAFIKLSFLKLLQFQVPFITLLVLMCVSLFTLDDRKVALTLIVDILDKDRAMCLLQLSLELYLAIKQKTILRQETAQISEVFHIWKLRCIKYFEVNFMQCILKRKPNKFDVIVIETIVHFLQIDVMQKQHRYLKWQFNG